MVLLAALVGCGTAEVNQEIEAIGENDIEVESTVTITSVHKQQEAIQKLPEVLIAETETSEINFVGLASPAEPLSPAPIHPTAEDPSPEALNSELFDRHRQVFDAIEQMIELYKVVHGSYPQTHEEFFSDIVQINQVRLPELGEGFEYVYNPENHTLSLQSITP